MEGGGREKCWGKGGRREGEVLGEGREECWGEGGSSQSSHHLPTHRKNLPYKERVNSVYMPVVQLYLQTIIMQVWQECTALSHYGRGRPPTNIPHSKHSPLAVFVKLHTKKQTELHPLRKAHNIQRHTHTHTHTRQCQRPFSVCSLILRLLCVCRESWYTLFLHVQFPQDFWAFEQSTLLYSSTTLPVFPVWKTPGTYHTLCTHNDQEVGSGSSMHHSV